MESTRSAPAPPIGSRGAFALVAGILLVTQLGFYFTAAALPLYLHDLGVPEGRVGFEVGLGSVAGLVLTFVVGPAINRYGGRALILIAGLVYAVAAAGMWLLPFEASVASFRFLQGAGAATITPSAMTLAAALLPARRATSVSLMGATSNLALAIGPPLGLLLYASHGAAGLFLPPLLAALIGTAAGRWAPRIVVERPAPGLGFDADWIPFLAANALTAAYFGGVVAYLPLVLHASHAPNAGIFFTADALGVMLLRIPTGVLADRYGSLLPKVLGLFISLGGIASLWPRPSILTLVLAGAGTGIGGGLLITGILSDLSHRSSDANRGTALSMAGASLNSGIFVGSAVSGVLIGPGGFHAILLFGAVTCLAGLPLVLRR